MSAGWRFEAGMRSRNSDLDCVFSSSLVWTDEETTIPP